jgi:hypothetical protein
VFQSRNRNAAGINVSSRDKVYYVVRLQLSRTVAEHPYIKLRTTSSAAAELGIAVLEYLSRKP